MNGNRPDVRDEDIGMRAFQLRKAKAVERAMERLRQGVKSNWSMFTQHDLRDLEWMMGELWAYEKRADWEDLHFSKLTPEDVVGIIEISRRLRESPTNTVETLEQVGDIIRARSICPPQSRPQTGPPSGRPFFSSQACSGGATPCTPR
jgi:hypothetical protein